MGLYIGVMSGTSLDGIDVVIIEFAENTAFKLIASATYPFPDRLNYRLAELISSGQTSLFTLGELDIELGYVIADNIKQLLSENNINAKDISAIGSHGQTIFHSPNSSYPFSMQIGNGNIIAQQTGITTINDFRQRDIAANGQGAPLVPAFHQKLFSNQITTRAIINIGGISNITLLPSAEDLPVIGFDSGPGNGLLNDWISKHRNLPFDEDGKWAAKGQSNNELLAMLMDEPYFKQPIPKSTGRELFNLDFLDRKLSELNCPISEIDVQATLLKFTVQSIADSINHCKSDIGEIYLCGGGAHNKHLVAKLRQALPNIFIDSTDALGLHPDWVEACAFAWLAYKTLNKQTGNITSVTGANQGVILGATYWSNDAS